MNELNLVNLHLNYIFVLSVNKNLCKLEYIGKGHVCGHERAPLSKKGKVRGYFMALERTKTKTIPHGHTDIKRTYG